MIRTWTLKLEVFLRNNPSGGFGVWFREDLSMRVWNHEVSQGWRRE